MIPALVTTGVAILALAGRRINSRLDRTGQALGAATAAGAGAALALVAASALAAPFSPWDTVRLAPAMALKEGIDPYASTSSGAVLSTMYGPVAIAAFMPAVLVPDAALAAILGRCMAFGFCVVPLILACCGPQGATVRRWRAAILVSAILFMILSPSLRYSTTFLHADAPALGLTGLACLLAARRGGPGLGAAIACVLAVWTKQTLAPLPLILLAIAWGEPSDSRRSRIARTARFGVQLATTGAASLAIFAMLFDGRTLYLNLVQVPGGVPWRGRVPWNVVDTGCELILHASPLLLAWHLCARLGPVNDEARQRSRGLLAVALALAPMAVLGRVKQAGDLNSFSPALYPLLLAVASRASAIAAVESPGPRRLLAALIAGLSILGAWRLADEIKLLARERPRDTEATYLAAHPGTVFFPWNPAVHLAVEGRATHHLFSAWERGIAGFPVTEAHLRSAMPPGCRYVAFPLKRLGPVVGFGSCLQMLERFDLLAQPATPVRLAGLPDYECYALTR